MFWKTRKDTNRMISTIKRTFTLLDKEIFDNLYKALVRHHLEYGNVCNMVSLFGKAVSHN